MKLALARHATALLRANGSLLRAQLSTSLRQLPTVTHVTKDVNPAHNHCGGRGGPFSQVRFNTSGTGALGTNYVGVEYPRPPPVSILAHRDNVLDLFSLKGKVASITGSATGIGFAVAEAYAQAGADIALWYYGVDPTELVKYLESTYGVRCKAYTAAVTDSDAVEKVVKQQVEDFGKVDIFVANAGVVWAGADSILDEPDNKEWDRIVRVNYDGVYYCAKAIGKHFRERGEGNLIITGSMSGRITNVPDTMAAYCSSKAAVIHLGKSLALEWANFARVNIVSPGYMKTDQTAVKQREGIKNWGPLSPLGRMGDRRELVGAYLYLASDASSFTTGTDLIVDGGYTLM